MAAGKTYILRGVKPEMPDHVWGIDITFVRMKGRFMYLVAIIDWYSRYIVSWELSETLERSFLIRALKRALATRKPEILNSDQGSHFTSRDYIELLKQHGIQISQRPGHRQRHYRALFPWEKIYYEEYLIPREVPGCADLY